MNFGYYLYFFPEEQQLTPEKVSLVTSILGGGGEFNSMLDTCAATHIQGGVQGTALRVMIPSVGWSSLRVDHPLCDVISHV